MTTSQGAARPKNGHLPLTGPRDPRHGTYSGYHNHGCRCAACTQAHTDYIRLASHRRGDHKPLHVHLAQVRATALARDNHGTESRYRGGCRCDACRLASTEARRRRRAVAVLRTPSAETLEAVSHTGRADG